jgi:hypothetical protein
MRPIMRCTRIVPAVSVFARIAVAPLALASCSTTRPATSPAVAPQPAAPPACLAIKAYRPGQLETLAAAVRALPPDSPLRGLVVDYARLRDAARAGCEGR